MLFQRPYMLRTSVQNNVALGLWLNGIAWKLAREQALQAQPKQSYEEAQRLLELSVRERLGTSARTAVVGDRVTLTLTGTPADALAQWLTQARVNARALPSEAHLLRNASGFWEGTLVLTLPPR